MGLGGKGGGGGVVQGQRREAKKAFCPTGKTVSALSEKGLRLSGVAKALPPPHPNPPPPDAAPLTSHPLLLSTSTSQTTQLQSSPLLLPPCQTLSIEHLQSVYSNCDYLDKANQLFGVGAHRKWQPVKEKARSDMAIFCLLCGKRFQTQTALQQHMEVHAGVRSYICSECNRTFPSHTALKRHLRSHTGEG
ncbi:hypothetical protein JZ751_022751 [Albula glossodonta]|uniref:C2H2-type domain-containing protein n=1 Tax=Albula glossodonta TaxID=121402 RepID=A0A8T2PJZ1_9TELE|nr:hypothetical protein JZ751_022751 [Albula glossodonta]